MDFKKLLCKLVPIVLVIIILLSMIPSSVFASPVDIFDGVERAPVNKNATQTAKNFYQYLWNVRKSDSVIVGATSKVVVGVNTTLADAEHDYYKALKDYFGVTPAIFAMYDSIGTQAKQNYIPIIVERYKQGSIPLFNWWGEPEYRAGTFENTDDKADIIVHYDATNPDRNMTYYNEWLKQLETYADYLEALEKAGVEVYIVRLFPEMNNTSKHGLYGCTTKGYQAFHRVWQQAVEYLTVERGLKGILFSFSPAGFAGSEPLYPGDDYVDLLAPTSYSNGGTGPIYVTGCAEDYVWMKNRPRPFGFSELGTRSFKATNIVSDCKETLESVIYAYPEASFAVLWYENNLSILPTGGYSNNGNYNGEYFVNSPKTLFVEDMIDYKSNTPIESTEIATFYSKTNFENKILKLSLGDFSAKELKKLSVDITKIKSLNVLHGCAVAVYESSDCTGKARICYGSKKDLSDIFKNAKSISIIQLENVAFEKDIWIEGYDDNAYDLNDGYNAQWSFEKDIDDEGDIIITIDLGDEYNIGQMSINHAGFFDDFKYNVRDFSVHTSLDGWDYNLVYNKIGNVLPASDFWFNSVNARYVQVKISVPNNSTSEIEKNLLYLAEIEVYGTNKDTAIVDQAPDNINTVQKPEGTVSDSDNSSNVTIPDLQGTVGDSDNSSSVTDPDLQGTINNFDNLDYGKDEIIKSEEEFDEKPPVPVIVIPEFYNYVWIIICGGVLLISAAICGIILFVDKKRVKIK